MPKSYWIIAVAFGLMVSWAQAQEPSDGPERQTNEQETPAQALPIPVPVELVEDEAAAEARQARENEASQREIDDLAAQQGMNRATQRMAADSRQMAWATWIGVGLLTVTLLLTLQANRAAVRAVDVTEKVGQAQTRAYLYCKSAKYVRRKNEFVVTMVIGNTGNSPASDVSVSGTLIFHVIGGMADRPRVLTWSHPRTTDTRFSPIISGGETTDDLWFFRDMGFKGDPPENLNTENAIFSDANEVWLDTVIRWSDVFGEEHTALIMLTATLGATPGTPNKKRSRSGVMDFREI